MGPTTSATTLKVKSDFRRKVTITALNTERLGQYKIAKEVSMRGELTVEVDARIMMRAFSIRGFLAQQTDPYTSRNFNHRPQALLTTFCEGRAVPFGMVPAAAFVERNVQALHSDGGILRI